MRSATQADPQSASRPTHSSGHGRLPRPFLTFTAGMTLAMVGVMPALATPPTMVATAPSTQPFSIASAIPAGLPAGTSEPQPTDEAVEVTIEPPRATDPGISLTPEPTSQAQARPRIAAQKRPLQLVSSGTIVDPEGLAERLSDELDDAWLGPTNRRAVTVRDPLTGEHLLDNNSDRLVTPASTTKILAAAVAVTGLDPDHRFITRVVQGPEEGQVVIVAGGDMLLDDDEGDPEAVAGRAGIADLAAQTAEALTEAGHQGQVRVDLDLSYAPGPSVLDTWIDSWVSEGYTGRIVQLGRSRDRAVPYYPSPREPEQVVAQTFRDALAREGWEVLGATPLPEDDRGEAGEDTEQEPVRARVLNEDGFEVDASGVVELARVESAPARDVLALALSTSDNAMTEQLVRQAAALRGIDTDQASITEWMIHVLQNEYGIDTTGVRLADASGLSDGTLIPVRVVADVLVTGADGSHPDLQEVLAAGGLPIAGYTGTLASRFHLPVHTPGIGNARAKTGSLPGVTSLAGTVVTQDGRLLVYAMTADRIEDGAGVFEARSVLDEIVAELARCGC